MVIQGYRFDAIHTFTVRTLRSLDLATRVTLVNATHSTKHETAYRIDVSVFGPSHRRERHFASVAELAPRQQLQLDCAPFVEGYDVDVIITFHLLPLRLLSAARDGVIDIDRAELYALFTAQDHYVEYYRDGFASGVLYQSGAFNYDKFSREATTILQAPKIYVSSELETFLSLMNCSPLPEYNRVAVIDLALVDDSGRSVASWRQELQPFEPALISTRERVRSAGITLGPAPRFYCLYGVSENATMVPLNIHYNDRTRSIGVEHSLPPLYYAQAMAGPGRARAITSFVRSGLFGARA